ncbi:cutinase [Bifidobacterium tissieri]|uniref:Cutinase n=1 Tax=Bifidobacterium tissieri TaxID=1630162 RepID=A0A261FDY3_9BIFI|nr:cutinase family protein [Bifidobacterium tissieri]OZG57380.1 cutinase [Bifidobacterium tissieri]
MGKVCTRLRDMTRVVSAMILVASILPLAACGMDDGGDAASPAPTATATASTSPSPQPSSTGVPGNNTADNRNWGDSGCDSTKSVRVIIARGTGESVDDGLLNPVASAIADAFPGKVQTTSLDYPATFDLNSVNDGVTALVAMLGGGAQQCPMQKTVLLGFSQGAAVVGDALSDPQYRLNTNGTQDRIPETASRNVLAVVMYGDPRFNGKATYNAGGFDPAKNGMLAPRDVTALSGYARDGRIVDYCAANDIICQQGGVEEGHRSYFSDGTREQGVDFVTSRIHTSGL